MKSLEERAKFDDFELADHYDFTGGIRGKFYRPKKTTATFQLDDDILVFLKKQASEKHIAYQALVNAVLREYVSKNLQKHPS